MRLGAWDILKGLYNIEGSTCLSTHIGLQLVNESAIGVNRLRQRGSLANQGFSTANGLSFLAADETVHELLDSCCVEDYQDAQKKLYHLREIQGHYGEERVYAIDPHRIISHSKRITPARKKTSDSAATKILQTFFCADALTGQPVIFTNGSAGKTCTSATTKIMELVKSAGIKQGLFLADKEHFTLEIAEWFSQNQEYEILMPAPEIKKIREQYAAQNYERKWAGYAIAEAKYNFNESDIELRLIIQREGETAYRYKGFLTNSTKDAIYLLSDCYPQRWTIENFFNFEASHGWDRASTNNLNIKYGKQTIALIAQAATYQLKKKLPGEYNNWTAKNLAEKILTHIDGDIRVANNKIIVTFYGDHNQLNLKQNYSEISKQLTQEGINPKIPWLLDYELEFRFK